ncbi:hypothetical protein M885DRAFT_587446 [Pelagophyceae sp. CCMP2097]|nr:hypothetical protein M885DRAFT_587446 [Pelagophyceae sp. CCMP2097]|mmetsp:Transcript_8879/g.29323  ORF Transcript_8879/g.29323 Transcript_8879/m.29323 type:complete len:368 (+) Transcript_8879:179-1282(+)
MAPRDCAARRRGLFACVLLARLSGCAAYYNNRTHSKSWHYKLPAKSTNCASLNLRRRPHTTCETFVIITQQRSGSRYVVDQLSSHPLMLTAGELFISSSLREQKARAKAERRPVHQVMEEHIDANYAQRCCLETRHVGFKWMTNQAHTREHAPMLEYLARNRTKVVFLWRRNLLRMLISQKVNKQHSEITLPAHFNGAEGNVTEILNAYSGLKVDLPGNPCDLASRLRDMVKERSTVVEYYKDLAHTVVYYEDLVEASPRHDATWHALFGFIGVPAAVKFVPSSSVIIHGNKGILDVVSNAAEVRRAYLILCAASPANAAPVDAASCAEVSAIDADDAARFMKSAAPWSAKACKKLRKNSSISRDRP